MQQDEFIWEHFKFNAEQRLKGFNFFILLSIFADGGAFTAFEQGVGALILTIIGGFIIVLAIVFGIVDSRSQQLLSLTIPALKEIEKNFSPEAQLFRIDSERNNTIVRYTFAFRTLIVCQFAFGSVLLINGIAELANK